MREPPNLLLSTEKKRPEGCEALVGSAPPSLQPGPHSQADPVDTAQSLGEGGGLSSAAQLARRALPQGKKCCSVGIPWRSRGADGNELA